MSLQINLLGPLEVYTQRGRIGKIPKKGAALLAFLSWTSPQGAPRERLADLLWPHQSSEGARHSLRNCLLELRRALPGIDEHLLGDFQQLRMAGAATDVAWLERISADASVEEMQGVADLWRGEFLEGMTINSQPYEDWLTERRARTLEAIGDLFVRLIGSYSAGGQHQGAIVAGRRAVAIDPVGEAGQRALMSAYAAAGCRGDALRQYKACAAALQSELGVLPDAETEALARAIAKGGAVSSPPREFVRLAPAEAPDPSDRRIVVGVAPLRDCTGSGEDGYLAELISEMLVTEMAGRLCETISLRAVTAGFVPGIDYLVRGSVQHTTTPGALRLNARVVDRREDIIYACRAGFAVDTVMDLVPKLAAALMRHIRERAGIEMPAAPSCRPQEQAAAA